jgi:hypothetical protein
MQRTSVRKTLGGVLYERIGSIRMSIVSQNLAQCTFNFDALNDLPIDPPTLEFVDLPLVQVILQRRCRKCKNVKGIECFYLKTNGKIARPDCRDCINAEKIKDHHNRERPGLLPGEPEGSRTHKECSKCHQLLPFEDFEIKSRNMDGLRGSCRACNPVVIITEKKCKMCTRILPASEFDYEPLTKDKLMGSCRTCRADFAINIRPS